MVKRASFKRSRVLVQLDSPDVGLKHAAAWELGKFVEEKNPSHAICAANAELSARVGGKNVNFSLIKDV